ncbi:uncharacterized protein LOC120340746 isoform X2 [Styela clava]
MDHSKYYKHSGQRRPEDRKKDKIKRRSLAQRQNRQKILQRTDLSPLKEKNNINEQPKNRKQMLEDWKKERKRKKFDLKKKENKPIFKVSSTIKYEDNWLARTSNAATSSSTEIKPSKAPEKKTKQYSTTGTTRTTRSQTRKAAITKKKTMNDKKVVKPEKSTKAESAEEIDADDAKLASNVNGADKVQPDTGGNVKETKFQLSHEEPHNEKPSENNQIVQNRPQSGSEDKFSESFAPVNHVFKAPAGLKNMTFSAVLPNSNESFVFSANGGSMNFSSSTPFASNQVKRRKPEKAPMVISSASASSSDENTDQTTIKVAKKEEKTSEEREKGGKNVSFASPRNKKRKARFDIEDSDDEKDVKKATPIGSQPRKRVMRKTPLPDELNTSCNEDMQASPTLKLNNASKEISDEDKNKDEIKGLKLNFDDVQSEEEDSCGLEMKYLLPSEPETEPEKSEKHGFDLKYLLPSVSDSFESSPKIMSTNIDFDSSKQPVQINTDSPGMILRNKRKSCRNPMSPFMKSSEVGISEASSVDLMSFSPLTTNKAPVCAADKKITKAGNNFIFPSSFRRSSRLKTPLDSLECDSDNNPLDDNEEDAVTLMPSLL